MLVVFPLGLLATSLAFDIAYLSTHNGTWGIVSYWMIVAGLIGGVCAGLFGWIDWFAIPSHTRAKAVGLRHGIGNFLVLLLFFISALLRYDRIDHPDGAAIVLSFIGLGLVLFTGWLGGELVDRLGIGVEPGAHPNAPNSLSDLPATAQAPRGRAADLRGRGSV
jgi:uncharacterized membrane protein